MNRPKSVKFPVIKEEIQMVDKLMQKCSLLSVCKETFTRMLMAILSMTTKKP